MRKVIVHGVHRSGTSMTANLLEKAGFWYAEDEYKLQFQGDNPKGFWERTDVIALNDAMLAEINLDWFTLVPSISENSISDLATKYHSELSEIAERLDKYQNWFIKDPRLSITWPIWRSVLKPSHHIVVHRHPLAVANSLSRRNAIKLKHGIMFWYHQTRMICKALKDEERVLNLSFPSEPNSSAQSVSQFNKFIDGGEELVLSLENFNSVYEPSLIHHKSTAKDDLRVFEQVARAWGLATLGDLEAIANMPLIELSNLSWEDVESKGAIFNLREKAGRELQSHQNEIQMLAKQFSDKVSDAECIEEEAKKIHAISEDVRQDNQVLQERNVEIEAEIKQVSNENEVLIVDTRILRKVNHALEQDNDRLEQDVANLTDEVKLIGNDRDEQRRSLLKIANLLKGRMLTKRYFCGRLVNKVISLGGIENQDSIRAAFDIAKFGHTAEQLVAVLPKESNRRMLLIALMNNPGSLLKRLSFGRIIKGFRMLLGGNERDIGVKQALLRYANADLMLRDEIDIVDPQDIIEAADEYLTFEHYDKPKVSIVIPVYNNYATTFACLKSIERNTDDTTISYEIIIADDYSTDKTARIQDFVEGIRIVKGDSNLGFLLNCNHAIPQARGEFIALLNNDTNVQENWLTELVDTLEADSSIGVVGPMFIYPDGRLQEAGGIIFSDASGWNYGRFDQPNKPEFNFARDVDYVSGACLVFRKTLWDDIGGFDEEFAPAYYEDTDFCFESRRRGSRVRFVPTSRVVHYEGVSHGSNEGSGIKKYQAVNREKFRAKWEEVLKHRHFTDPKSLFSARCHGVEKKKILFIDHHVPFHDKDAGSKVAQRYIELMVEQGIHVIFLGDNFYPHQPYTKKLQTLGVEVLFGEFYKNNWFNWLQENSRLIDAIYLNRPHISKDYIDRILSLEHVPHIAYHGADLHYVRVGREEELGLKVDGISSVEWKELEFDLMRKCDVSLWLSDSEVMLVSEEDSSINVMYKPMYWFEKSDFQIPRPLVHDKNLLFVGSFGHPPNRDGLDWFLKEIYPEVMEHSPDVKLTIIGSNCPDEIFDLDGENIDVLGFVSEDELIEAYKHARVSIVPLRYGAGLKGKVIESMRHGVTVLTTSMGAEGLPSDPSDYLNVVDDPDEYAKRLVEILRNDNLIKSKVQAADALLVDFFSKETAISAVNTIMGVKNIDK